ncbi:hypothetical protein L9F63_021950, partial [Diploptera punctata]
ADASRSTACCYTCIGVGGCMDARSNLIGAVLCHLSSSQISTMADAISRLQDDCCGMDGKSNLEHAHPRRFHATGHEGERKTQVPRDLAVKIQRKSIQLISGRNFVVGALGDDDSSVLSHRLQALERTATRDSTQLFLSKIKNKISSNSSKQCSYYNNAFINVTRPNPNIEDLQDNYLPGGDGHRSSSQPTHSLLLLEIDRFLRNISRGSRIRILSVFSLANSPYKRTSHLCSLLLTVTKYLSYKTIIRKNECKNSSHSIPSCLDGIVNAEYS